MSSQIRLMVLLASLVPLIAGGCSILPTSGGGKPMQTFTLNTDLTQIGRAAQATGKVLRVSAPNAHAGYENRSMAYSRRSHELSYYAFNEWVDTPSRLLRSELARALERSGAFTVIAGTKGVYADLRLDTEIVALYQDYRTSPAHAWIVLRVQLIDLRAQKVLATRQFEHSEVMADETPYDGVEAINSGLSTVLPELVEFSIRTSAGVH